MKEDYTKYLSIDNGKGILISKDNAFILDKFSIDYVSCTNMKDLIILIEEVLDECYDEELEGVLENLSETYYYQEVHK